MSLTRLKKSYSFLMLNLLACIYILSKIIITNYFYGSYSKSLDFTLLICMLLYFYSFALIYINISYYVEKKYLSVISFLLIQF